MPDETEAEVIEKSGEHSQTVSYSIMSGNLFVNLLCLASLSYLWGSINGLQLATHMQLFNLKFPANASFLNGFLVEVACFDLIPTEVIWNFLELPDRGSYSVNFASSGYEFVHAVENLGTAVLLIMVYLLSWFVEML